MELLYLLAGLIVGCAIGISGIGGGSLMTPILVLGFGLPPLTAVSTDLLYAALTKLVGTVSYARAGLVNWSVVNRLLAGSLPGAALALLVLERLNPAQSTWLINRVLGLALILTALVVLLRARRRPQRAPEIGLSACQRTIFTIGCGLMLGLLVTLSSVGAGALGTAFLMVLNPTWPLRQVIATDLAHAVVLTAVAGLGHWQLLGQVDPGLLGLLLLGAVPGVVAGATLGRRLPNALLQPALGGLMLLIGLHFVMI